jgi:hypothetical protein
MLTILRRDIYDAAPSSSRESLVITWTPVPTVPQARVFLIAIVGAGPGYARLRRTA